MSHRRAACSDPERWHREQPSPELRTHLIEHARSTVTTEVCQGDTHRWWQPKSSDVEVIKVYAAKTGERLAMVRVRAPETECEDPKSQTGAVRLVRIDAGGKTSTLGSGIVVDAGDYDGDGKSEVVVKYGGYNEDGYRMFYDGFSREVALGWSYH